MSGKPFTELTQPELIEQLRELFPELPPNPSELWIRFEVDKTLVEMATSEEVLHSRVVITRELEQNAATAKSYGLTEDELYSAVSEARRQRLLNATQPEPTAREKSPAQRLRGEFYRQVTLVVALVFAGLMLWMSFVASCTQ